MELLDLKSGALKTFMFFIASRYMKKTLIDLRQYYNKCLSFIEIIKKIHHRYSKYCKLNPKSY